MNYNFDAKIERKDTYSAKWDGFPMFKAIGISERVDENTLPLFTADMDFQCPDSVKEEILKTAEHNLYGYTTLHPSMGGRYYKAVKSWFQRRYHWNINQEEIVYVDGTISAIRHAILAFTKQNDGVIINRPIYPPFTKVIQETGRKVVNNALINKDGYYEFDFEDFERKAAFPETTCFLLCSPHNPTGRIWKDEELIRLYEICKRHQVLIVSDEVHCDLTRSEMIYHPIATLVDGENLIACTAANKTFNIAGLKATNVIIKNEILRKKYQEQIGMIFLSPFTIAATVGAYNGGEEWLEQLKKYLDCSFDWVLNFIHRRLPKVKCICPESTYVLWMDFREYGLSDEEIHKKIYVDANVVLEDGIKFDPENGKGFQRICLSTRLELIQEAFERIAREFEGL